MNYNSPKPDDRAIAQENWDRYVRARDRGHVKYVELANKCEQFYIGEQWDDADRRALEAEGRPALTINNILPTVNAALGEQANRQADIRCKPRRGAATQPVADVLSKLMDHILEENNFSKHVEPTVYADGLIMDRGYYDVRLNHDDNVEGEIEIDSENPIAVIPDPDATSYDPRKWNEVFITRWVTPSSVGERYGMDKQKQVEVCGANATYGKDSIDLVKHTFGGEDYLAEDASIVDDSHSIRNVRIVERQYYKITMVEQFIDPTSGETRQIPDDWTAEHRAKVQATLGLTFFKSRKKRVRWTISADAVLLHDGWSPYRTFTIIPYYPIFRRGRPIGMVRNLLSPQEFVNKSRSQELHIVNTTANSGWLIEEGSLTNMTEDDLAQQGAKTGVVVTYAPGRQAPQKIKPNPVPAGVDRISQKGAMDIKEISGINESMLGQETADVSGIALGHRTSRGQVQLQVPFNNLEFSRKLLAEKILELVQDFYTAERVFHITNYAEPEQPREQLIINQQTAERVVNDITVGEYDVVVASSPARDSFDEMQFAEALSLRNAGVAIPDHFIIESSHLSRKTEISRILKDISGFGEMTEEEAQMAQMQQQMAMQQAQLALAKLDSEVQKITAEAALNAARAEDLNRGQFVKQVRELEAAREVRMQELKARLQMSEMSRLSGLRKTEMQNNARLTSDALKIQAAIQEMQDDPTRPNRPEDK
jgi:hypothetical protein